MQTVSRNSSQEAEQRNDQQLGKLGVVVSAFEKVRGRGTSEADGYIFFIDRAFVLATKFPYSVSVFSVTANDPST